MRWAFLPSIMVTPKNSGKAPSFQFYPADWRKDTAVQMLEFHDRGIWFEMICIMHESTERGVLVVNSHPMPTEAIARILGLDNQTFNQTLSKLLSYGVAKRRESDGAIYCKRMVEDEKLSQIRREAGKQGGNPSLVNQNGSKTEANGKQTGKQKPTPSSSSSSSVSPSSSSSTSTPISTNPPPSPAASPSGLEGDEKEKQFNRFWNAYPKRKGRTNALKAWLKQKLDSKIETILEAIQRLRKDEQWTKNGGQYIPHPASWLNSGGWDDEITIFTHNKGGNIYTGPTL